MPGKAKITKHGPFEAPIGEEKSYHDKTNKETVRPVVYKGNDEYTFVVGGGGDVCVWGGGGGRGLEGAGG